MTDKNKPCRNPYHAIDCRCQQGGPETFTPATTERKAVLRLLRRQRLDEEAGKGYPNGSPAQVRALVVCDVLDKLVTMIENGEHR